MFQFESLEVYKRSKQFNQEIRTRILPINSIDLVTKDQLVRAGLSIMLNIAEGSGRYTKPDKRRFYIIARGSLFESIAICDFLYVESLIDQKLFNSLYHTGEEISKMLYKMINSS